MLYGSILLNNNKYFRDAKKQKVKLYYDE